MDEFDPCPTAHDEITQRIDVLKARIAGFDCEAIKESEARLTQDHARLARDEKRLAEWLDIARRSA